MKINVTFYWIHINSMFNILKIYALQHLFNVFIFGHSTCGKNTAIFFHILLQFNDRVTCYIQWSCHVSFLLYLIFFTSLILNSLNLVSLISLFQFSPTFQRTAVLTFVLELNLRLRVCKDPFPYLFQIWPFFHLRRVFEGGPRTEGHALPGTVSPGHC